MEKLELGPSPEQAARGRQEAIEAVRLIIAGPQLPMATVDNLLGFSLDDQGWVPGITVANLPGEGREAGFDQCTRFCEYLDGCDTHIQAFNRLSYFQQILAIILTETVDQHPTQVKDNFLSTTDKFLILAITKDASSAVISNSVIKEVEWTHTNFLQG